MALKIAAVGNAPVFHCKPRIVSKKPGHYRIYEYLRIEDQRLCIQLTKGGLRTDVVSAIMDLLDMRYALTERVLFHHAKCVASLDFSPTVVQLTVWEGARVFAAGVAGEWCARGGEGGWKVVIERLGEG